LDNPRRRAKRGLLRPPGRDAQQVRRDHHRGQRPPVRRRCSRNGGIRPEPQLRDSQLDCPGPVSRSRRRYPLREFTQSGLPSPNAAPRRTSTSASISAGRSPGSSHAVTSGSPTPASARTSPRPGHNVTFVVTDGHFALLRLSETTSKERGLARNAWTARRKTQQVSSGRRSVSAPAAGIVRASQNPSRPFVTAGNRTRRTASQTYTGIRS
jgi:hypothetical protein